MIEISLHPEDAELLYKALLAHDGRSLRSDWQPSEQSALTRALDRLRAEIRYNFADQD